MTPSLIYTPTVLQSIFFENANSFIQVRFTQTNGAKAAKYVRIQDEFAYNTQIQKTFEMNTSQSTASGNVFDIYFPLLQGYNSITLNIYPDGADPLKLDSEIEFGQVNLPLSPINSGSALLLGLEDKEKNVRVLPLTGSAGQPASYLWTATILPDATARIANAVIHVTNLYDTNFIALAKFKANGQDIQPTFDPSEQKYHLYFQTRAFGTATLEVTPGDKPCWGHLIYWPFADNVSEVARIVIFDPSILGSNLFGPVPDKNPIKLSDYTPPDGPSFTIQNDATPRTISDTGFLYIMVNDKYEKTVQASSQASINFIISTQLINGSSGSQPQANTSRYIYAKENGDTNASPYYSFFAYSGTSSVSEALQQASNIYDSPVFNEDIESINNN
ncbi:hypothetical protein [Brucella inopinata]|uniref:hypothetical protein n=1 Tax=Brucella inopinata TaxID=1218315 RepID=UPI000870D27B|nr:hypothetical protein [Brucella inopinata]SCD25321.1 hypothetical protein BR141012304_20856 [Brucella inopinata]